MRLFYSALFLLHCSIIWTLSLSLESEPEQEGEDLSVSNETDSENIHLQALLDYESGSIFYKDNSISACLVEKIPESILESAESHTFKIPIPSEEVCIGSDNELLRTEHVLLSEPGLLFCNGLAILDISKLAAVPDPIHEQKHQSGRVRRKRQSNGYYRSSTNTGEARTHNWNAAGQGQASQAQVQGQVFGTGFFSGQAQSQNSGMSQSQVQLSGVGIRGQIASSSGNAQAQLSIGNGAGSGQASGLGDGPSNSQVQVTLGQHGEESMASASATSGGARAGAGGVPGASAFGGQPTWGEYGGQFGGLGHHGAASSGGPGYGFTPGAGYESGTRGATHVPYGNGAGLGDRRGGAGQVPRDIHQSVNGHGSEHGSISPAAPGQGLHQGQQGLHSNVALGQNGHGGGQFGFGQGGGSGFRQGFGTNGVGSGPGSQISGSNGYNTGIPGTVYEQGRGISQYDNRLSTHQGFGIGSQGVPGGPAFSENGFGRGASQSGAASGDGSGGLPGNVLGSDTSGYSTHGGAGGNGHYRTATRDVYGSGPAHGDISSGNVRYGRPGTESNGASYYTGGGVSGRPYAQSNTPGAYASTYGQGQAQAQTVYFGNAGNGQYVPLRYDQSSHPGASPGTQRFQDQQVGLGNAGQRQVSQNGGGSGTFGYSLSHTVGRGVTNGGHRQNGLRNGYTPYNGNGVQSPITTGQQPIHGGAGMTHLQPGTSAGSNGAGTFPSVPGFQSSGAELRPDRTSLGRPSLGVPGSQSQVHPNTGISRGQGQPQVPTGPTDYRNGHKQASTTTTGTNGHQATLLNGQSSGGYSQQQVPSTSRNGHTYRINGNGQAAHHAGQSLGQTSIPGSLPSTGQDGFSPSYGISRPSQEDPDGRKCTIITFSCTIVIESNGRAKICRPNAVRVNGNGGGGSAPGGNGAANSKICCC